MNRALALEDEFAREVRAGLLRPDQKTLPCRYFYDAVGSALFDAITVLPEYGLTRADARVIERHAPEIAAAMPGNPLVVELGSGSGVKTRKILEALGNVTYCPIDVSPSALAQCARSLAGVARVGRGKHPAHSICTPLVATARHTGVGSHGALNPGAHAVTHSPGGKVLSRFR